MEDETVSTQEELTPEKARSIVHWSFFFSQGDLDSQINILRFVQELHPNWDLSNALSPEAVENLKKPITKTITNPNLHRELKEVETNGLSGTSDKIREGLKAEPQPSKDTLLRQITEGLIKHDWEYLCHVNGRPRKTEGDPKNFFQDPYLSQTCYFALEGNSTPVPEYDQMMLGVKKVITDGPIPGHVAIKLDAVKGKYKSTPHPYDTRLGLTS